MSPRTQAVTPTNSSIRTSSRPKRRPKNIADEIIDVWKHVSISHNPSHSSVQSLTLLPQVMQSDFVSVRRQIIPLFFIIRSFFLFFFRSVVLQVPKSTNPNLPNLGVMEAAAVKLQLKVFLLWVFGLMNFHCLMMFFFFGVCWCIHCLMMFFLLWVLWWCFFSRFLVWNLL